MLSKIKIFDKGLAGMICEKIGDTIVIYGGSHFKDKFPPDGVKTIFNDVYELNEKLEIVRKYEGKIAPNYGIVAKQDTVIWYIQANKLYKLDFSNQELKEEEIIELEENFESGFAYIYNDKLIFGNNNVYEYDIKGNSIRTLGKFPYPPRNQMVYAGYKDEIIILGGASNICHLDAYKYNITENRWSKLQDIPCSLTGAAFCEYDEENILIIGGFNKEVFDEAVKKLSDLEYKRAYFNKDREFFKWNDKVYLYNLKNDTFKEIMQEKDLALCGAGLVKNKENEFVAISGETQPGHRNTYAIIF